MILLSILRGAKNWMKNVGISFRFYPHLEINSGCDTMPNRVQIVISGFIGMVFAFYNYILAVSPANITLKEVGVVLYLYPVRIESEFRCSDPKLDELYQVCNWTLRNCMHDGFEDCPSREQRQWVGDAYVETMVNYTLFGDTQLVKKLIRQVAQSQRGDGITQMANPGDSEVHGLIIPDYCLYWISILYQYYWYTGDTELVVEIFPMF